MLFLFVFHFFIFPRRKIVHSFIHKYHQSNFLRGPKWPAKPGHQFRETVRIRTVVNMIARFHDPFLSSLHNHKRKHGFYLPLYCIHANTLFSQATHFISSTGLRFCKMCILISEIIQFMIWYLF